MPPKQKEAIIEIVDISSDEEDDNDLKNELNEEPVNIPQPEPQKIIKTRVHHLVECPSCKKMITEHSLKFFHHKTCKGGHIQPERRPYKKKQPPEPEPEIKPEIKPPEPEISPYKQKCKFTEMMNKKKENKNFDLFRKIYNKYQ